MKSSESWSRDKQNINANTTEQIKAKSIHMNMRVTGSKVRVTPSLFLMFCDFFFFVVGDVEL